MNESPAPLACSLPSEGQAQRGRELQDLAHRALTGRDRAGDGVLLTYRAAPGVKEALRDLVRREAECCPFLDLELSEADSELSLRVSGPAETEEILDLIYETSGTSP